MKNFNCTSEKSVLEHVIIGNPRTFSQGERINEAMRKYYGTKESPQKRELVSEFSFLQVALQSNGVQVHHLKAVPGVPQQLAPRDIAFVIGKKLFISNMRCHSRKKEFVALKKIISEFIGEVIEIPQGITLEGGNVYAINKTILVGIGLRTDISAIDFLREKLPEYSIEPIFLSKNEEIIHLDAVFNVIDDKKVFVYKPGIQNIDLINKIFTIFPITKE